MAEAVAAEAAVAEAVAAAEVEAEAAVAVEVEVAEVEVEVEAEARWRCSPSRDRSTRRRPRGWRCRSRRSGCRRRTAAVCRRSGSRRSRWAGRPARRAPRSRRSTHAGSGLPEVRAITSHDDAAVGAHRGVVDDRAVEERPARRAGRRHRLQVAEAPRKIDRAVRPHTGRRHPVRGPRRVVPEHVAVGRVDATKAPAVGAAHRRQVEAAVRAGCRLALLLHERVVAAAKRSRELLRAAQRQAEDRARSHAVLVEGCVEPTRAEDDLRSELAVLRERRIARVAPQELPCRRQRESAEAAVVRDHVDVPVRADRRAGDDALARRGLGVAPPDGAVRSNRGDPASRGDVSGAVGADRGAAVSADGGDDPSERAVGGQRVDVAGRARDDDSAVGADRRPVQDVLAADLEAPLDGDPARWPLRPCSSAQRRESTEEDYEDAFHLKARLACVPHREHRETAMAHCG